MVQRDTRGAGGTRRVYSTTWNKPQEDWEVIGRAAAALLHSLKRGGGGFHGHNKERYSAGQLHESSVQGLKAPPQYLHLIYDTYNPSPFQVPHPHAATFTSLQRGKGEKKLRYLFNADVSSLYIPVECRRVGFHEHNRRQCRTATLMGIMLSAIHLLDGCGIRSLIFFSADPRGRAV